MPICPQCHRKTDKNLCEICRVPTTSELSSYDKDDMVGETIGGRFQITTLIESGGMWSLYGALDLRTSQKVAIKVLDRDYSEQSRLWASLENVHTAKVSGFGKTGRNKFYLVMENLEGRTLRSEMHEKGRLTQQRVLFVAKQVCESLVEAHDRGILHKNLTPENIFISRQSDGTEMVKVLNYGFGYSHKLLQSNMVGIGTPRYMSPEACKGHNIDQRSDLYSLGIIMYEAAAGTTPFQADTVQELMLRHVYDRPLSLITVWPEEITVEFDKLVMSLIAKSPSDRPSNAREVLRRIETIIKPDETEIEPKKESSGEILQDVACLSEGQPQDAVTTTSEQDSESDVSKQSSREKEETERKTPQVVVEDDFIRTRQEGPMEIARRENKWKLDKSLIGMIGLTLLSSLIGFLLFGGPWNGKEEASEEVFQEVYEIEEEKIEEFKLRPITPLPFKRIWVKTKPSGMEVFHMQSKQRLGKTPLEVFVIEGFPLRLRLSGYKEAEILLKYEEFLQKDEVEINLLRK